MHINYVKFHGASGYKRKVHRSDLKGHPSVEDNGSGSRSNHPASPPDRSRCSRRRRGQRGWNAHPGGGAERAREFCADPYLRQARAGARRQHGRRGAPRCRDAAGPRKSASVGPCSTMRPRYMTATWSARWCTTARLWLIRIRVRPSSLLVGGPGGSGSATARRHQAPRSAHHRRGPRARRPVRVRSRPAGAARPTAGWDSSQ